MDERIKETYRRIYAELFVITLSVCCISMLIKFILFHQSVKDCLLEFLILIGSPVYMAVRTRMLGVTQAPLFQETSRLRRRTGLAVGLLTVLFVFAAVRHSQNAETDFLSLAGFAVSFLVSFLLAQSAYRKNWTPGMMINTIRSIRFFCLSFFILQIDYCKALHRTHVSPAATHGFPAL